MITGGYRRRRRPMFADWPLNATGTKLLGLLLFVLLLLLALLGH